MFLKTPNANPVLSFKNLRRLIGILGMLLPLICFLGGIVFLDLKLGPSISSYYYSNVRDGFVGILVGVAMFLITYRGYEYLDDFISTLTGICALGVAIFPCYDIGFEYVGFFNLKNTTSDKIHLIFAASFFILLAANSIFIFTKTNKTKIPTKNKRIRNIIYFLCGLVIVVSLLTLVLLNLVFSAEQLNNTPLVFILETVMLEAFGISWLVKGETLFRD